MEGRVGEELERKGRGGFEQNKLFACMECSDNKKIVIIQLHIVIYLFTVPKYEYRACISEMLLKDTDDALVLPATSKIFSTHL